MKRAATLLICLLMPALTQALPTERIFTSGFEVVDPPNDCSPTSIRELDLEDKFLRRAAVENACIRPGGVGVVKYCTGNGCGGNPGCPVPLFPPTTAIAMLLADFVAIEEAVGVLTIPFTIQTTSCVMTIQFSAAPLTLRHHYTLRTTGLDALTLFCRVGSASRCSLDAVPVLLGMPAYTSEVSGGPLCFFLPNPEGMAAQVVAEAADAIVEFEFENAPPDALGATVCPITQSP